MSDRRREREPLPRRARAAAETRVASTAIVEPGSVIGSDVVVGAFSLVASGAKVGAGTRIQSHTSVWSGVVLGEDVFVGPGVTFTNVIRPRVQYPRAPLPFDRTLVGDGATLGAQAVLVAPIEIGTYGFVGAGAVVTRDVPPHALVLGAPARVRGWVCVCGKTVQRGGRRPKRVSCARCGTVLERGPGGGLSVAQSTHIPADAGSA